MTKVSGGSVKGLSFPGSKTLASVGDQLFWFDYRSLVELENTDKMLRWGDLGKYGLNLTKSFGGGDTRPIFYTGEGVGYNDSATSYSLYPVAGPNLSKFNIFHNGTPHIIYVVAKVKFKTGAGNAQFGSLVTYLANPNTGAGFRIDSLNRRIRRFFENGTTEQSFSTGNNIFSDDTYTLFKFIHYGTGFSNNVKLQAAATSSLYSQTITLTTNNYTTVRFLYNITSGGFDVRVKMMTAYDLTGKTVSDINDFDTAFVSTLKQDSEYSGLTT